MFGFFKKSPSSPTVTPAQKEWIETYFIWFIKIFGLRKLKEKPFFLMNHDDFPYSDFKDELQFDKLVKQLCDYLDINADEISFIIFDNFTSKQWNTYIPLGQGREAQSIFNQNYSSNERKYQIRLAQSNFENQAVFIKILMKELLQVRMVKGRLIKVDDKQKEGILELACIFWGFGIITANTIVTMDENWIRSNSNLFDKEVSYANALVCYITETDGTQYYPLLNSNTKSLFKQDFEYLKATDDTKLTPENVIQQERFHEYDSQIKSGFKERDFDKVMDACKALVERLGQKTVFVYSNWGYALIGKKKYLEAIEYFNKAIDIDPFSPYPYNNRGYCKLNLDDLENALIDIQSSIDLDTQNAFAWRNLGAYYLKINDAQTALEHFTTAINLNPETELIHFYLSKTYSLLNNLILSEEHLSKSLEKEEYNDSMF